ncbi:helix-turn-helix transcriptional regulator [Chromobacterium piscinae]|uniref:helix-turn-helix domain-containing protein n=1 Tax=Chromobacterium piscinae TaxID=686831 RepID=UPI003209FE5B
MAITEFGKSVKKARIDAGVSLSAMAESLGVSAAFLSGLEGGRKNISDEWVNKIHSYFQSRGVDIPNLRELADMSNQFVPLEGLLPEHQRLVTAFARRAGNPDLFAKMAEILKDE